VLEGHLVALGMPVVGGQAIGVSHLPSEIRDLAPQPIPHQLGYSMPDEDLARLLVIHLLVICLLVACSLAAIIHGHLLYLRLIGSSATF
jgi:hypothetical protein